ncbi:hypothetical protein D3C84_999670 [compost metagenome]
MHIDHRLPFLKAHLEEEAVTHNAGVVYDRIDSTELIQRTFDDAVCGVPLGNALDAGHGFTAGLAYFFSDCLGSAAAIRGAAQIIDYHPRAFGGESESIFAANTTTGPGDNDDFVLNHGWHVRLLRVECGFRYEL